MKNLRTDRLPTLRVEKTTAESRLIGKAGAFGFMSRDSMRLPQNGPTRRSNLFESPQKLAKVCP
jgi:hypothetical protein